jgi:hypothetical protein
MRDFDFAVMKPREIEAYFKQLLLDTFGNAVEDYSEIRASHGTYTVAFNYDGQYSSFAFKKKSAPKIAKAIRALK